MHPNQSVISRVLAFFIMLDMTIGLDRLTKTQIAYENSRGYR